MPTISQLPAASRVTAADQLPISQGGAACSVSVGTLLAGTQPAVLAATGSLLGRTSLGPGGPESVEVGIGLLLNVDTLVANGADHASFPVQGTLTLTDEAVLSSDGNPKLLELSLLRGLFSPGSNISIDQYGTISAALAGSTSSDTSGYSITALPTVATISSNDLVAISQAGSDHTVTYANLIDGQTIDQAQLAAAASATDTFLVAQGGNVMLRQNLGALWAWLGTQLPGYQPPTLELTTDTTLSAATHNGRMLVCSQPIILTAASADMGSGFVCDLLNVSAGNITLGSGIISSSGTSTVAPWQAAAITCVTYSGGTLVYAMISALASSLGAPGQVSGLAVTSESASAVTLAWTTLSPSPSSYMVQYRVGGTAGWSTAPSVTASMATVTGLLSATSYDFVVYAANSAGVGSPSAIVTATTSEGLSPPGQVIGLTTSNVTANGMSLAWSVPGAGGTTSSYTVQYRVSGTTVWSTGASGLTSTLFTVTGLLPATSYDFVVSAVNGDGTGIPSTIVTATTSLIAPSQVTGLTAGNATSSGMSLAWSSAGSGGAASSYTVQYRVSGTTPWSIAVSGLTSTSFVATGLLSDTSYDFEVLAVNAAGTGPASSVVTASTASPSISVTSVIWNVTPSGSYMHGNGAIGINAQVSPSNAPVQFGFSTSLTVPPTSWTVGSYVNSNLWGAYVNTPSVAGTWYAWVEGTNGSTPTVYPTGFLVT